MRLLVDLLHPLDTDVGVDLRCRQTGMAQQGLHAAEIGAVVEEMGGETVPQLVRADIDGDVRKAEILADHGADVTKIEPPGGDPFRGSIGPVLFRTAHPPPSRRGRRRT